VHGALGRTRDRTSDSGLARDEYASYVKILRSKIEELLASPDTAVGVFDGLRGVFVPNVRLPESLFTESGLLEFAVRGVCSSATSADAEQACLLLAQMLYLADSLTMLFSDGIVVALLRHLARGGGPTDCVAIVLNNVLAERNEWIPGLIRRSGRASRASGPGPWARSSCS